MSAYQIKNLLPGTVITNGEKTGTLRTSGWNGWGRWGWVISFEGEKLNRFCDVADLKGYSIK